MRGVLRIVQYNWHYYVVSLLFVAFLAVVLTLNLIPANLRIVVLLAGTIAGFWFLSSLLASYYVYDHAGVTRGAWIQSALARAPRRWLNVHAGLEEFTDALTKLFPESDGVGVDIYDPVAMTEPSIARARQLSPPRQSAVSADPDVLPFPGGSHDTLFLLLAAHEIRNPSSRVALCREAARVLGDPGQLLLAEHLRDWRNFLAFGPGCLHFHSRREWMRVAREAGMLVEREGSVTPFVRWFLLRKGRA